MMTTTVHTNISSTSVDGITVLRMIMVDTGRPVCTSVNCCCVGVADTVAEPVAETVVETVVETMVPRCGNKEHIYIYKYMCKFTYTT